MQFITYMLSSLSILSLASIIFKRPWTMMIARKSIASEFWSTSLFLETNMIITGIWTILFALAAFLSATMPPWVNLMVCAVYLFLGKFSPRFGLWYSSKRIRSL